MHLRYKVLSDFEFSSGGSDGSDSSDGEGGGGMREASQRGSQPRKTPIRTSLT